MNDRKNLNLIEYAIKRGEELVVSRLIDKDSGTWRKIVGRGSESLASMSKSSADKLDNIIDEIFGSQKVADIISLDAKGSLLRVAVEVVRPKINLVVFGAGHVGQGVALIGAILGYDVILIDDRAEFAIRKRVPDSRVRFIVGDYLQALREVKITNQSAIVIVTRGHQYDEICLRGMVQSNAGYIGMIGSKRRIIGVMNRLRNNGYSDGDLAKVHAPIGLDIGAKSPQEIAVAIHAEIINHFNVSST